MWVARGDIGWWLSPGSLASPWEQGCAKEWEDSCAALGMWLRSEMAGPAGGTGVGGVRLRSSIHTLIITNASPGVGGGAACLRR